MATVEGHHRAVRHVHATRSGVGVARPGPHDAGAVEVAVRPPVPPRVYRDSSGRVPEALRGAQRLDSDLGARLRNRDRDADLPVTKRRPALADRSREQAWRERGAAATSRIKVRCLLL